ncbi:MAG: SRPBCC family protein [Pseudomonadota bacterium]
MLQLILTLLAILILAVLVLGYLWPDKVHVERETVINAPPEKIFGLISDFVEWDKWSPWAKLDPDAKYEFSGDGVGQRMAWSSEKREVGSGSQEIIAMQPPRQLVTALDFGEMGGARATFDIAAMGEASKVVWALDTNMREGVPTLKQPMATFFGFFMDKMIGKSYEEGLANLKEVAEAPSQSA